MTEQRDKLRRRVGRRNLGAWTAAALVGSLWWVRRRPFRVAVEGDSMAPALRPGEFLVAVRFRPGRTPVGSVVVVEDPRRPGFELVKRLTGVPGDVADGVPRGAGEYWVAGARPDRSTDSRTFGPVRAEQLRGVVRFRYWPPSRFGPVTAG
jgi:signal peptidase I